MKSISSSYYSDSSYLGARIVDHTRGLAVDEPYRDIHGAKVIRLWRFKPKPRKVLGQQGSDEAFAHITCRHPKSDVPNSVIAGEDKRKSWDSYTKDQRPKPKTR